MQARGLEFKSPAPYKKLGVAIHACNPSTFFLLESNLGVVLELTNEIIRPSFHYGLYGNLTAHALWAIKKPIEKLFWG